jgi:hypothetical protein
MLNDFFNLNPGFKVVKTEDELLDLLTCADAISDIEYAPDSLAPIRPKNKLKGKTFTNVSFSKTELRGITFTKCTFIDCLFIGTKFISCEFHGCRFEHCNPYKASFLDTYINPEVFVGILDRKKHSNIGVGLFQQLMENSFKRQEPEHAQTAQYHFRKWLRFQHTYEYFHGEIGFWPYIRKWLPSFLYDHLAGYGIRVAPFLWLTAGWLLMMTAFNRLYWEQFDMSISACPGGIKAWVMSFYYTVVTMTTLGYGDIVPRSNAGMVAASAEALLGLLWLSLLASIVIKKVWR